MEALGKVEGRYNIILLKGRHLEQEELGEARRGT